MRTGARSREPQRGARLALALHLLVAFLIPFAEPWHDHHLEERPEWHAEGDRCEDATSLEECALLRGSEAHARPGDTAGVPAPFPLIRVPRSGPHDPAVTRPALRDALPRGPPAT
ncbi:MAG TPA: hypothetical protein VM198_06340 [Longimicrobiales bacterium]|nr:hypothetical protein [Longimicrobiales bacterium]